MPKLVTLSGFFPAASSSSAVCAHPSVDQRHSSTPIVFFMVAPVMSCNIDSFADIGRNRPGLDPRAHRKHDFALHADETVVAARLAGTALLRAAAAHRDERAHAFLSVARRVAILGELAGIVPMVHPEKR